MATNGISRTNTIDAADDEHDIADSESSFEEEDYPMDYLDTEGWNNRTNRCSSDDNEDDDDDASEQQDDTTRDIGGTTTTDNRRRVPRKAVWTLMDWTTVRDERTLTTRISCYCCSWDVWEGKAAVGRWISTMTSTESVLLYSMWNNLTCLS